MLHVFISDKSGDYNFQGHRCRRVTLKSHQSIGSYEEADVFVNQSGDTVTKNGRTGFQPTFPNAVGCIVGGKEYNFVNGTECEA